MITMHWTYRLPIGRPSPVLDVTQHNEIHRQNITGIAENPSKNRRNLKHNLYEPRIN